MGNNTFQQLSEDLNSVKKEMKSNKLLPKLLSFCLALSFMAGYSVSNVLVSNQISGDEVAISKSICEKKGGVYSITKKSGETLLQCVSRTKKSYICISDIKMGVAIDLNQLDHVDNASQCGMTKSSDTDVKSKNDKNKDSSAKKE